MTQRKKIGPVQRELKCGDKIALVETDRLFVVPAPLDRRVAPRRFALCILVPVVLWAAFLAKGFFSLPMTAALTFCYLTMAGLTVFLCFDLFARPGSQTFRFIDRSRNLALGGRQVARYDEIEEVTCFRPVTGTEFTVGVSTRDKGAIILATSEDLAEARALAQEVAGHTQAVLHVDE